MNKVGEFLKYYLIIWITMMTVMAILSVHDQPHCVPGQEYGWGLPIVVFWMLAFPACCGYIAGKLSAQVKKK